MSLDDAFEILDDDARCAIQTGRFGLRPLEMGDTDDLLAHFGDPRVTRFLDIAPLTGRSDARAVITWAEAMRGNATGVRWAIRDGAGGFLGTCGFHLMEFRRGRRAELGYDLGPAHWGQGVMDEVLPVVMAFGFGVFGLRRIEAMVTPGNDHSCALLERHGFRREGLLREFGYWRDRFWDQILFARLASD